MDWNKQMVAEIRKAGLNIELRKVPKQRCSTLSEVEDLQQRIKTMKSENNLMRLLSNG